MWLLLQKDKNRTHLTIKMYLALNAVMSILCKSSIIDINATLPATVNTQPLSPKMQGHAEPKLYLSHYSYSFLADCYRVPECMFVCTYETANKILSNTDSA